MRRFSEGMVVGVPHGNVVIRSAVYFGNGKWWWWWWWWYGGMVVWWYGGMVVWWCACVRVRVFACVRVCVCERERETEREDCGLDTVCDVVCGLWAWDSVGIPLDFL